MNENNFFSHLQFGFQEGAGCIEASFTILETINHYLERGSTIFGCFLDVRKAFDTVWIDGLFYKLFTELGINGRFWLVLKDLYTDVNAKVFFWSSITFILNFSGYRAGENSCTFYVQSVYEQLVE